MYARTLHPRNNTSSNYKHCFFLHFNSNSAQSNVYHFLVILWFHVNNYTFKKINWNILSLFKCQKSKNIRFDEYFCYVVYLKLSTKEEGSFTFITIFTSFLLYLFILYFVLFKLCLFLSCIVNYNTHIV